MCRAFDKYGSINQTFVNALSQVLRQANDEIVALPHFQANAMLATCAGFMSYIKRWTRLEANVKAMITSFLNQPGNMDAARMGLIPKSIFTMLDSNFAIEIYPALPVDVKQVICRNLGKEDCIIRSSILDNLQCQSILLSNGGTPTEDDMDSILNLKDFANWSKDTWVIAFNYTVRKLSMRHFEVAPIDVVLDSMKTLSKSCGNFSSESIGIITKRIIANVRSLSSIPADMDSTLMDLLQQCGADPSSFRTLYDDSMILSTMDVSKTSPGNAMKFIEHIPSFDPSTLSREQIPRLVNAMSRKQLKQLNATEMEHALCILCQTTFDRLEKGKKRTVTDVFRRKLPTYTDPVTLDDTKAACMECMIPYFPASDFRHIPTAVIEGMVSGNVLQQMDITSRVQARTFMSLTRTLYNRADGKFTSENLWQMGPRVCLKALNATDYEAIPDSSFDEYFLDSLDESLREEDSLETKAVMNKLKSKFQKQLGTKKLLQSKFASLISPADIENMTSSDIFDIENGEYTLEVSPKQSRNLMKRIKQERESNDFDLQSVQNLGPLNCGFTISDIEHFPKDSSFVEILNAIGNNECSGQIRELYRLRKDYMGFDSISAETLTADTTPATISDISPPILLMHSQDELNKYGTHVCTDIVGTLQTVDTKKLLTKKELQDKWNYFAACQSKQTTGTFSGDELNLAGSLLCGINEAGIRRIDSTAIEATIKSLDGCTTLGKTERDAALSVYTSHKQITSGAQVKPTTLRDIGTMAAALSKTSLTQF
ncbi:uncharacterized protein LOC110453281 [Mizuhopecten yessoensis]|nr:uncharacterized protein LOC110453281 [Mizuhopecten yessoensis]